MLRWHWQKTLLLLILPAALFLAGCGQQFWYQPSKSFEQCKQDKALCLEELNKLCEDQAVTYRIAFIEKYMKDRGYRPTMEFDLPLDVKRADSESESYWLIRGVAGRDQ